MPYLSHVVIRRDYIISSVTEYESLSPMYRLWPENCCKQGIVRLRKIRHFAVNFIFFFGWNREMYLENEWTWPKYFNSSRHKQTASSHYPKRSWNIYGRAGSKNISPIIKDIWNVLYVLYNFPASELVPILETAPNRHLDLCQAQVNHKWTLREAVGGCYVSYSRERCDTEEVLTSIKDQLGSRLWLEHQPRGLQLV